MSHSILWPGRVLTRVCLALIGFASINCAIAQGNIRIGGTGTGTALVQHLIESYQKLHPGVEVTALIPPMGSNGGLRALAAGTIQVAVVSFPINQQTVPDDTAKLNSIPWVRTPMVFTGRNIAGRKQLSMGQVADIYAGQVTRWPDGSPLRLVTRTERETDTTLLRGLSGEMDIAVAQAAKRIGLPFAENDLDNQNLLERTPGSFGVIGLGQVLLSNSVLKPASLDGVAPSAANLRNGSYRFAKSLYLVVPDTASPATLEFCRYLQSPGVIASIERFGFIPQAR